MFFDLFALVISLPSAVWATFQVVDRLGKKRVAALGVFAAPRGFLPTIERIETMSKTLGPLICALAATGLLLGVLDLTAWIAALLWAFIVIEVAAIALVVRRG